jgi:hypothetical protein
MFIHLAWAPPPNRAVLDAVAREAASAPAVARKAAPPPASPVARK